MIYAACRIARTPDLAYAFHPRNIEKIDFARTINMLHVVRLKLIRDGAIGIDRQEHVHDSTPQLALRDILNSYVRHTNCTLLSGMRIHQAIVDTYNNDCDNYGILAAPAPHGLNFVAASRPIVVTAKMFPAGTTMFALTAAEATCPTLAKGPFPLPEPIVVTGNAANAEWKGRQESDGSYRFYLYAINPVPTGAPILVQGVDPFLPEGDTILIRFDGSCKKGDERISCGSGVVVYLVSNDTLTEEVTAIAIPLPQIEDSMSAEAMAAARACTEAVAPKRYPQYAKYKVIIQGDNKPVINYWWNRARLNSLQLSQLFKPILTCVHSANIDIQWQHIPGEHNPVADALANQGANVVANESAAAVIDANGDIIRPGKGTMLSPFQEDRAPFKKADAIRYVGRVAEGIPAIGTLILPERYRINDNDLCRGLPPRDLPTVLKFLRQRRNAAQYVAAAGNETT